MLFRKTKLDPTAKAALIIQMVETTHRKLSESVLFALRRTIPRLAYQCMGWAVVRLILGGTTYDRRLG